MNCSSDRVSATDLLELHGFSRAGYDIPAKLIGVSVGKLWNSLHGITKITRRQHADLSAFYLEKITSRIARLCTALGR